MEASGSAFLMTEHVGRAVDAMLCNLNVMLCWRLDPISSNHTMIIVIEVRRLAHERSGTGQRTPLRVATSCSEFHPFVAMAESRVLQPTVSDSRRSLIQPAHPNSCTLAHDPVTGVNQLAHACRIHDDGMRHLSRLVRKPVVISRRRVLRSRQDRSVAATSSMCIARVTR